ncbi:hypothetical protein Taro_056091, partial [Colocasia esculenta]|nr:hypothetical protein [Colocasia esculenta]
MVWPETQTHIAFPRLQKLEFHDMPVWKEWLGAREGDFPRLRKLILKHCPKLRALPRLPPSLEELEVEACDELTSLSTFDSNQTQSLKFLKSLRRLSLKNCPKLDLSATEGNPSTCTLQHKSLTEYNI